MLAVTADAPKYVGWDSIRLVDLNINRELVKIDKRWKKEICIVFQLSIGFPVMGNNGSHNEMDGLTHTWLWTMHTSGFQSPL